MEMQSTQIQSNQWSFIQVVKSIGMWLGLTALFLLMVGGLSPLYSDTQPYQFAFGLAAAGKGQLASDWFANTKNPWLLFQWLVQFTVQFLGNPFFYLYQIALVFIYLYSMVGIADHFFNIRRNKLIFFSFLAIYITSYAVFWPGDYGHELYSGIATQFMPFQFLIPNSFAALLFLSIYLFLKEKPAASILSLVISCYFHPSYLIVGAALVCAYMLVMFLDRKSWKQIVIFGGSTLLLVVPLVLYFYGMNTDATQEQFRQAVNITAGFRLQEHTHVEVWWDNYEFIKLIIVLSALFVTRKKPLFYILLVGFVFVALPTIVLAIHPSNLIGSLMLWRPSMVVVPLATTALIASWVSTFFKENQDELDTHRWWVVLGLTALVLITLTDGVKLQIDKIEEAQAFQVDPLMLFVREDLEPGDQYLTPIDRLRSSFRLETGAPVFVNWRQHPWGTLDTIEWYQRIQAAEDFYASENPARCELILDMVDTYGITHIIMPRSDKFNCPGWEKIFADEEYRVYTLSGRP